MKNAEAFCFRADGNSNQHERFYHDTFISTKTCKPFCEGGRLGAGDNFPSRTEHMLHLIQDHSLSYHELVTISNEIGIMLTL